MLLFFIDSLSGVNLTGLDHFSVSSLKHFGVVIVLNLLNIFNYSE